jgi:hypothetical protein
MRQRWLASGNRLWRKTLYFGTRNENQNQPGRQQKFEGSMTWPPMGPRKLKAITAKRIKMPKS